MWVHSCMTTPIDIYFISSVATVRQLFSSSQTFLHVDPQLQYTIFCRPRYLAQQLLIQGKYVSK